MCIGAFAMKKSAEPRIFLYDGARNQADNGDRSGQKAYEPGSCGTDPDQRIMNSSATDEKSFLTDTLRIAAAAGRAILWCVFAIALRARSVGEYRKIPAEPALFRHSSPEPENS